MESLPRRAGGDPALGTGNTIDCEVIREVLEDVSQDASDRVVVESGQFFRTRSQNISHGLQHEEAIGPGPSIAIT